jgi:single-strand DNA-binding protein
MLIGNLGQDPETRFTEGGSAVCNFSVATSEKWTKDGEAHERTEWHKITVWGKNAENCEKYLKKGSKVYIEGKLQTEEWEDKEGNKRYTTKITANNVTFLSGKGDDAGDESLPDAPKSKKSKKAEAPTDFSDEDIPF